ncbi:MAG: carboxymuconolactone decarboxylase family protein, partial [Acetobacteraceae bacterium]
PRTPHPAPPWETAMERTAHIQPLPVDATPELRALADIAQASGGYVATSMRIMAHKPAILLAFRDLIQGVMRAPGEVPQDLKWLVAHTVSSAAGCRYCQAHTAADGAKAGLAVQKVQALADYPSSPLFTAAERAAVALAWAAGEVPNAVTRAHFDALRVHFTEPGIVELVSVISVFGWLNRWNDTFASDLEDSPLAFARQNLSAARGWDAGKHGA